MNSNLKKLLLVLLAIVLCIIIVFPVYWMLVTSITPEGDTFSASPNVIPRNFSSAGYENLMAAGDIFLWMRNTFIVAFSTAFITIAVTTFSAYSLSRFRFKLKKPSMVLILFTQMLPDAMLILPLYMLFRQLGLLNKLIGLILINTTFQVSVGTFIMKNFFDTIPKELDEAAYIDGCGKLAVLLKVLVPSVTPAMAATGIIAFFEAWNEYMFSVTMVTKNSKWVTSVGLSSFIGMYSAPITQIMAGAIIFTIPSLVIFVVCQKYIVSGLTAGSVKG